MNILDYMKPELFGLIPVLYCIGIGLKKSKLPDRWIPCTLGGFAIILCATWIFTTEPIEGIRQVFQALYTALTQGVLTAGASVYINQIYVQARKDE